MHEFFTWSMLGTYTGAVLMTTLITQIIKGVGFIDRIPTRVVSYVIAFAVLVMPAYFGGAWSLSNAALSLFNAVIVSLAANGGYDTIAGLRQQDNDG